MKIDDIRYSPIPAFSLQQKVEALERYLQLSAEFGAAEQGRGLFDAFQEDLERRISEFQNLVLSQTDPDEPDDLEQIRALRAKGPRKLISRLPGDYAGRLRGAFCGRMAGCTLGAALEFQPVDAMQDWAEHFGDAYPLTNYWSHVKDPGAKHYLTGKKIDLTKGHMDAVPPDDDTIYTLLGLMTMEQYGMGFTQQDIAATWMKYLPLDGEEDGALGLRGCWWGERILLKNLHRGIALPDAGVIGNPYLQSIAAWTRADSYGYACPGWPEKAAELAYRDASMNHRRNGVYGCMFMAATVSAAFAVDDPMEAVRIGLTEIPENCLFAQGVRWALGQHCGNYRQAAQAVWNEYAGMFNGSALTNALHVVMGLDIGKKDFTKTIGETVAMSGDNDCTGATAGSILGAVIGIRSIPAHWTQPFHGRMHIYLLEQPEYLQIEDVCLRFEALAGKFTRA